MSKEQSLKQEQDNLIYQYGMLNLKMDALRVQASGVEQQMVEVKENLKINIETQKKPKEQELFDTEKKEDCICKEEK